MNRRRVVITGMGAVTPLGNDVKTTWQGLTHGKSGIDKVTIFDTQTFPTKIAGEIKNFDFEKWPKLDSQLKDMHRNGHFALQAASEAMAMSKLGSDFDHERFGVYFGAGDGGFDFPQYCSIVSDSILNGDMAINEAVYYQKSRDRLKAGTLLEQEPSQVVNNLAHVFKAKSVVSNCLTACAASSQAIGEAAEIIRHGTADVMMTGGSHSMIHPLGVAGFNLLTALSTNNADPQKASRPFDKNRDGFVLSEGGAVLILEELEHAKRRKAHIYGELIGYGGTADAFRLTDPHPEGRGAIRAMRLALQDAGLGAADIDYINAHGTSTQLNDSIETRSVKEVFGSHAKNIPMSSIKSMLGHMIAAAGAVELITCILTIREGLIPPTINYETRDEECDLDYVPNKARKQKVDTILSNSFGFGGQNIALIARKFEG